MNVAELTREAATGCQSDAHHLLAGIRKNLAVRNKRNQSKYSNGRAPMGATEESLNTYGRCTHCGDSSLIKLFSTLDPKAEQQVKVLRCNECQRISIYEGPAKKS